MSVSIFSPAALGHGKLRWQDKGKGCCMAKAQDWEPQNPRASFGSPTYILVWSWREKSSFTLLHILFSVKWKYKGYLLNGDISRLP